MKKSLTPHKADKKKISNSDFNFCRLSFLKKPKLRKSLVWFLKKQKTEILKIEIFCFHFLTEAFINFSNLCHFTVSKLKMNCAERSDFGVLGFLPNKPILYAQTLICAYKICACPPLNKPQSGSWRERRPNRKINRN